MNFRKPLIVICLIASGLMVAQADGRLTAAEARNHVGENATVCGVVASTHYAATTRGRPTFLNIDKPYPNQIFTVLIWGSDRPKFGAPEQKYRDKNICVTGKITSYRDVPEIIAYDPEQIRIH